MRRDIDTDDFAQHDGDVPIATHDAANRCRNIRRGQTRGCHLVKQRLEEMKIAPVNQRHIDGRGTQSLGSVQAAEPATHDHHAMAHIRQHRIVRR